MKIRYLVGLTLICGALVFNSCGSDDTPEPAKTENEEQQQEEENEEETDSTTSKSVVGAWTVSNSKHFICDGSTTSEVHTYSSGGEVILDCGGDVGEFRWDYELNTTGDSISIENLFTGQSKWYFVTELTDSTFHYVINGETVAYSK